MTQRFGYDDAATWHTDPAAGEDDLAEDATAQLMAEINDAPIGGMVRGMLWAEDECRILELMWENGLILSNEGYAVRAATEDDVAEGYCPGCRTRSTFVVLPDEGEVDPDWIYWACTACGCAPRNPYELTPA